MSAKMLPSLTEENRDLQKQIGCMNGIFQLFDRHYFVTGRRISGGHNHKKLLQASNHRGEPKRAAEKSSGKNLEVVKYKPRVSTESPRTSFSSSSCPSTLSLIDHSKTVQSGPPPFNQSSFSETPTEIPRKERSSSLQFSQQPLDLRDIIKDSMHREYRGLSVKTVVKEEGRGHAMKHIDSPRPSQQCKSGQPRVPGFHGSIHALPKLQEPPRNFKEEKDGPLQLALRERPRSSYDGRETRDAFKSTTKFKELPRLSLDSRESSLRNSVSESRLNILSGDLQRDNGKISQILNTNQEPGSNKRPPNAVVKLMGLEAFPDSDSRNESELLKPHSKHNEDSVTRSSNKAFDRNKQHPALSPQFVQNDPASPSLRNASSVMKPISNSRLPLEPAPWRQIDAGEDHPRKAQKNRNACRSFTQTSFSVYGEIEKRISELEFRKSGKNLRALKQILEAMQKSKKGLENQKGEQPDLESLTSRCSSDYSRSNQVSKALNWQSNQRNPLAQTKGTNSPKRFDYSSVPAKQARPMDNSRISSSSVVPTIDTSHLQKVQAQNLAYSREDSIEKLGVQDLYPRNNTLRDSSRCTSAAEKKNIGKTSKTVQTPRATQLVKAENYATFGRSSGAASPRFQEKKHEIDKQSHIISQPPKFVKARRKSSRNPIELDSSTRKLRPHSTNLQQGNEKLSSNTEIRNFSHHGDTGSVQSESNSSLASPMEGKVTSLESSIIIKQLIDLKERNLEARLREDVPLAELTLIATEQPSPVSVLDATFYREESPSPVKKKSTVFQDYETSNPDEEEWHLDNQADLSDRTGTNLGDKFNQRKPENVKDLVHILRLVNTTPEEASMDKIASLCTSASTDHKYITKMLLASGLLKDIGLFSATIQLHPSCHLINPNFFHVLEQAEQYTDLESQEHSGKIAQFKCQKVHRKILFDTVNEILVRKFASEGPFMPQKRTRTCQEFLRELYLEIDLLQAKPECCLDDDDDLLNRINVDMMQQPDDWADYQGGIPAVVLDIERLIFKDLITEVLTVEGVCRNLFTI